MEYIGHKSDDGRLQPLQEHLENTGKLCARFAACFGMEEAGRIVGLYHDIGKYSAAFQKRILEDGPRVDHSTAGAKELLKTRFAPFIFCVAGHHSGLLNMGTGAAQEDGTLLARLKNFESLLKDDRSKLNYGNYRKEISLKPAVNIKTGLKYYNDKQYTMMFLTRMLFSCLVDADFLDTEAFMQPEVKRGGFDDLDTIYSRFTAYIRRFENPEGSINQKRCSILKECLDAADLGENIFSLTVPTGGGKTIASLGFALKYAVNPRHRRRRIIYVIPYTSIIEQNADVLREIAGADNVIEHHCNVDYGKDEKDTEARVERHKLATENWDTPIVVTTNVQFFESLYANKTSRCRKLHNIADSVVIFDEAQMLPPDFLKPCVRAIQELSANYGVTSVLCTATQPSLNKFFPRDMQPREICSDVEGLYNFFRRVGYETIKLDTLEEVAARMNGCEQVLCIVNTRKDAQEIFGRLAEEGRYHLSTYMCPAHRRLVIREIKNRLAKGLSCRVISTSLVEAGVDLDFPAVFRELAGLDSIIQAAGRCNREGKKRSEDSKVYIFSLNHENRRLPSHVRQVAEVTKMIMGEFTDIASVSAIKAYFDRLHLYRGNQLDKESILEKSKSKKIPFADIARDFVLIEDNYTRNIFVPFDEEAAELLKQLKLGIRNRELLRKAGAYMVSVYEYSHKSMLERGQIEVLDENISVLSDSEIYDSCKGLKISEPAGRAIHA